MIRPDYSDQWFEPQNLCSTTSVYSPSGKYTLYIQSYKVKNRNGLHYFYISRGLVYNVEKNILIAEIKRNRGNFCYGFAENHINGHDYLLCGFHYQGLTIIELDTCQRADYLFENSAGLCSTGFYFAPDRISLLLEGCHWDDCYCLYLVDFSNPMNLPWKTIYQYNFPEIHFNFTDIEWLPDSSGFTFTSEKDDPSIDPFKATMADPILKQKFFCDKKETNLQLVSEEKVYRD